MILSTRKIFHIIGFPFSPFYSQLMRIRSFLYRKKVLKSYALPVPVISVGNLTMGGSGKSPLVIFLCRFLLANGCKPAVISRGYRGTSQKAVNIVSDGKSILMNPRQAGDEPVMIAQAVPGLIVATGKKRIYPARHVIERYGCDSIILDDGFQHLSIRRDLDLVLFDTVFFAGNSRVFPGGDLREPVSALNRCDAFILTNVTAENKKRMSKCRELLLKRFPEKKLFTTTTTHHYALFYHPSVNTAAPMRTRISELPERCLGFCGIANPERFWHSLRALGLNPVTVISFPDHHLYGPNDMQKLSESAKRHKVNAIITTEKDMVKLAELRHQLPNLYSLPLDMNIDHDFKRDVLDVVKNYRCC